MRGDIGDIVFRLRSSLPKRWFSESSPNLEALLASIANPWAWLYAVIGYTIKQSRINTACDEWLDLIATDYFGLRLRRKISESDSAYRARIRVALLREAATRGAIVDALENITGSKPKIFEPANAIDTGGYGALSNDSASQFAGLAYGQSGGWGSLDLPCQFFVDVARPVASGVAMLAGYGTSGGGYGGGYLGYVSLSLLPGRITDVEIQNTLRDLLPTNAVAWLRIS